MEVGKIELTKVPAAFVEDTAILLEWLQKINAKRLPPEAARLKEMIEEGPPMEDERTEQPAVTKKQGENSEVGYCRPPKEYQFKPGQSGNPKGRPRKEDTFSDIARNLLQATVLDITLTVSGKETKLHLESDKPLYHGIAAALLKEAYGGNVAAARELLDRTEGKPSQSIALNANIKEEKAEPMSIEDMKKELETVERLESQTQGDD